MSARKKRYTIGDVVGFLNKKVPFDYAEEWDNVGLLLGDHGVSCERVLVSVNLGPEVLAAAKQSKASLIICHHPPIFKPISKLTSSSHPYLFEAAACGIAVVALHTNFDLASESLSKSLAEKLGFKFQGFLKDPLGDRDQFPSSLRLVKFVTFVPEDHLEKVRAAVCAAGGGAVGNYTECTFISQGQGGFKGGSQSSPSVGTPGKLTRIPEYKLETVVSWKNLSKVVTAARENHPYEQMAYDTFELVTPERAIGYGFLGDFDKDLQKQTFQNFIQNVKKLFLVEDLMVVPSEGELKMEASFTRLAFSPGSGSAFVRAAAARGAEVYLCGEVGYHQMLEARQLGLTLVVLGHSYSERYFVETVRSWCHNELELETSGVFEKIHFTV